MQKVTVMGSSLCSDTRAAIGMYEEKGVEVQFKDFSTELSVLKEFLAIRDSSPLFENVRANKGIGIPLVIMEDGTMTLNPQDALAK